MQPHTRAMIAASAHAFVHRRKVVGIHDHAAQRHLRIAAECRGSSLQGYDGDRAARFGGTLPELYDAAERTFISIEVEGCTVRGHDRGSATSYDARVSDQQVQLYDHGEQRWFSYDVQLVDEQLDPKRGSPRHHPR